MSTILGPDGKPLDEQPTLVDADGNELSSPIGLAEEPAVEWGVLRRESTFICKTSTGNKVNALITYSKMQDVAEMTRQWTTSSFKKIRGLPLARFNSAGKGFQWCSDEQSFVPAFVDGIYDVGISWFEPSEDINTPPAVQYMIALAQISTQIAIGMSNLVKKPLVVWDPFAENSNGFIALGASLVCESLASADSHPHASFSKLAETLGVNIVNLMDPIPATDGSEDVEEKEP